jgi:hypothetical protein
MKQMKPDSNKSTVRKWKKFVSKWKAQHETQPLLVNGQEVEQMKPNSNTKLLGHGRNETTLRY